MIHYGESRAICGTRGVEIFTRIIDSVTCPDCIFSVYSAGVSNSHLKGWYDREKCLYLTEPTAQSFIVRLHKSTQCVLRGVVLGEHGTIHTLTLRRTGQGDPAVFPNHECRFIATRMGKSGSAAHFFTCCDGVLRVEKQFMTAADYAKATLWLEARKAIA